MNLHHLRPRDTEPTHLIEQRCAFDPELHGRAFDTSDEPISLPQSLQDVLAFDVCKRSYPGQKAAADVLEDCRRLYLWLRESFERCSASESETETEMIFSNRTQTA
jgi:hypothetical protein